MDLRLDGSFADMILISDSGFLYKSRTSAVFILTNPGQLNFYDGGALFSVPKSEEGKAQIEAQKFPVTVPTTDPNITVTNLYSLNGRESQSIPLKVQLCIYFGYFNLIRLHRVAFIRSHLYGFFCRNLLLSKMPHLSCNGT
jgi:hypothetical protein